MNKGEKLFKDKMERLGWKLYKTGWPDFLLHKKMGKKDVICFVEVKNITGLLTKSQNNVLDLLGKLAPTFLIHIGESGVFSKKNYEIIKSIEEYSQDVVIDYVQKQMDKNQLKKRRTMKDIFE
jgi:hypothetical protein